MKELQIYRGRDVFDIREKMAVRVTVTCSVTQDDLTASTWMSGTLFCGDLWTCSTVMVLILKLCDYSVVVLNPNTTNHPGN